jgi:hypothetical protein
MKNSESIVEKGGTNMWRKIKIINVLSRIVTGSLLVGLCAGGVVYAKAKDGHHRTQDHHYTYGDAQLMLYSYPPIFGPGDRTTVGLDIRPFPGFYDQTPYCVEDWHVLALRMGETVLGPFNPEKADCLDCPSCEDCIKEAYFTFDQFGDWEDPNDPGSDPDPLDPFDPTDDFMSTTRRDAFAFLGGQEAVFYLDDIPVPTVRTSVNLLLTDKEREPEIVKAKEACLERFNLKCEFRVNSYGVQWGRILAPEDLSVGVHTLRVVVTYLPGTVEEFVLFDRTLTFTVVDHDPSTCHVLE